MRWRANPGTKIGSLASLAAWRASARCRALRAAGRVGAAGARGGLPLPDEIEKHLFLVGQEGAEVNMFQCSN